MQSNKIDQQSQLEHNSKPPANLKDIVINFDLNRGEKVGVGVPPKFPIPLEQLIHVEPLPVGGFCAVTLKLTKLPSEARYSGEVLLVHPNKIAPFYSLGKKPKFEKRSKCNSNSNEPEADFVLVVNLKRGKGEDSKEVSPNSFHIEHGSRMDVCINYEHRIESDRVDNSRQNSGIRATPWICRVTFT